MLIERRPLIASLILPLLLWALPGDALAQAAIKNPFSMDRPQSASARIPLSSTELLEFPATVGAPRRTSRAAQAGGARDALINGVLVGAVVGAVALGAFAAVICKAQQEPGGPSCVPDAFRIAAVSAAIGAAGGLLVDAALARNGRITVSLGIRF